MYTRSAVSAEMQPSSQIDHRLLHLGGTWWHRRGSRLRAERLQPRPFRLSPARGL